MGGDLDTNGNSINFGDNDRANFGDSQDLQLYHDGSNSYIYDQGTGYLVLQSGGPGIRLNKSNAEVMVDATPDGAVTLYHDNSAKIATSSTGVDITGTATVGAVTYTGTDGTDGQVLMTDGAGNASFEDMPSSTYLDVKDFGATGNGVDDDTTAIQNAINHASTRGIQTIFFPKGHYKYTTLRFYHDQTDNTAFQGTNLYIGDGADTTFDFGWYIADASDLTVTVEGTEQTIITDYTVSGVGSDSGGTVTFTSAPPVPSTSTITRDGDGQELEFFYSGEVVPGATNLSVTVGGVTSTDYTVDIGKRLVVFNAGFAPPSGTGNVVITIKKTVKIASNNRDGRFQLRGTGRLAIADLVGLDKNRTRLYGSVLESTGDGIIIDTDQEFSTPVDARNFVAKDLTFLADNTGQIIRAEKNPGMSFNTCSFKQFNPAGTGLEVRNCWFFTMNQCFVVGQRNIDTFTATADGSTLEQFTYTFDNPSATSDILVQFNGGALTETTDYTVTMGATKTVTLTSTGATKIGAEYTLSGNRTINIQVINTGDGISSQFVGRSFGSFAGLWTITQSLVDSFANGVHWTGGTVTNLSIRDTAVQNCGNYNIYGDAGVIQQMLLDNVYFENQKTQGVHFIKGNGTAPGDNPDNSAVIRNLRMTNCFMLGGGTNPRITGSCIDLDNVDAIDIEGMYVFRVRQPFLDVARTKNFTNVPGEIKNSIFASDSGQTKFLDLEPTVYLLSGVLPNVHNCIWPGFDDGFYNTTNNILLFDSTVASNFPRQYTDIKGTTGTAKFGFGDTIYEEFASNYVGAYNITGSNSRTYYNLKHEISTGLKVILPDTGEVNDGRLMIIKNNEQTSSSFPYINVVNNSGQNATLAQLAPGQAGLFIVDVQSQLSTTLTATSGQTDFVWTFNNDSGNVAVKQNGTQLIPSEYSSNNATNTVTLTTGATAGDTIEIYVGTFRYLGRVFSDDLYLSDNQKISFGRSDDLQLFHQSSDSTNRLVSGGTSFALPTADGTSGQSIITDGSGNLTFGTAAGTGITAVVEDTTPQLGGNLDLNGNDITGTGNLDFTGTINTVLSVDGTTEDVFITGATPGLEFVENDSGGSRMRMAWNTSGSFPPTLYQSLYGDSTTTYGGINIQTRASDGSGNQVVYAYDPANDRNWWGTRAAGDVAMQLQSDGTFNVRGGDVVFEDSSQVDKFFWDASETRLGLGTTDPDQALHVEKSSGTTIVKAEVGSGSTVGFEIAKTGTTTQSWRIVDGATVNGVLEFYDLTNSATRMAIDGSGNVGVKQTSPGSYYAKDLVVGAGSAEEGITIRGSSSGKSYLMFADGTSGNEQYRGYLSYDHADDSLGLATGASQRMHITSAGNVGINTTNPSRPLHVNGIAKADSGFEVGNSYIYEGAPDQVNMRLGSDGPYLEFIDAGSNVAEIGNASGELALTASSAEKVRITNTGDFLVGKSTTVVGTAGFSVANSGSMTASIASSNTYHVYDTTNSLYRFFVTSAGQINATSTSITAISDESLKENIRDLDKGLDTVLALQPRRFDWKNGDGNDIMGFVAQEVEEVMPELVHDYKYSETETKLGLKMGDMVPTLVKAIQDQQDIIENLKSRIEQLEGAN